MAQMFPSRIELTSAEAFAIVAALDAAHHVLRDTPWLTVSLEVEDAHATLINKLFPEDQE